MCREDSKIRVFASNGSFLQQRGDKKASRVSAAVVTPEFMRSPAATMTPAIPVQSTKTPPVQLAGHPLVNYQCSPKPDSSSAFQATRHPIISKYFVAYIVSATHHCFGSSPFTTLLGTVGQAHATCTQFQHQHHPHQSNNKEHSNMSGYGPGGSQVYTKPIPWVPFDPLFNTSPVKTMID